MLSASHVNADGKKSALISKGMCIRCGFLGRFAAASPIVSKNTTRNLINDPFIGHLIQRQWICFLPHAQQIEDPTIKSNNSIETLNKCIQQSSGVELNYSTCTFLLKSVRSIYRTRPFTGKLHRFPAISPLFYGCWQWLHCRSLSELYH